MCNNKESLKNNLLRIKDIEVKKIGNNVDIVFDLFNAPAIKNNQNLAQLEQKIKSLKNCKNRIL